MDSKEKCEKYLKELIADGMSIEEITETAKSLAGEPATEDGAPADDSAAVELPAPPEETEEGDAKGPFGDAHIQKVLDEQLKKRGGGPGMEM